MRTIPVILICVLAAAAASMPLCGQLCQRQICSVSYRSNNGPWSGRQEVWYTVSISRESFRMRVMDEKAKCELYRSDGTQWDKYYLRGNTYFYYRCIDGAGAACAVLIIVAPDDNVQIQVYRKGYAVQYDLVNGPPLYPMGL